METVVAAHLSQRFEDLPEAELRYLVERLSSLREGDLGVSVVAACGTRAGPFLREALLRGRPTGVAEGRRRVVYALSELGAKDVLLEYLRSEKQIDDPVLRLAEETVENAAARALAKSQTDEIFEELLCIASKQTLPGVIEGLAAFGRPQAIPFLIRALEDDVRRRAAKDRGLLGGTLVQAKAKAVQDLLTSLAQHLAQVLNDTARALHFNDAPAAGEFETLLREMPVFTSAPLHLDISRRPMARLLGKRVVQRAAERQLRQRIGLVLMQALRSHSKALRSWAEDIVAQFRRIFEASANTYRAQLERFLHGGDVAVEDKRRIETDLETLGVVADAGGSTVRVV